MDNTQEQHTADEEQQSDSENSEAITGVFRAALRYDEEEVREMESPEKAIRWNLLDYVAREPENAGGVHIKWASDGWGEWNDIEDIRFTDVAVCRLSYPEGGTEICFVAATKPSEINEFLEESVDNFEEVGVEMVGTLAEHLYGLLARGLSFGSEK